MIKALPVASIVLTAFISSLPGHSFAESTTNPQQEPNPRELGGQKIDIRDLLISRDKASYRGFVIRRLHKRIKLFGGSEIVTAEASYIKVKRNGKTAMKFDGIYHPMGNDADFGFFPLLGGKKKQLIVSLDTFRTGTQWIVSLGHRAHLIYNGSLWGTGRETDDFGIVDLDGDGVYEITAWITDFYDLQDKMSMSQIPLPMIIFKYDKTRRRYLPANRIFRNDLGEPNAEFKSVETDDELQHRSIILGRVLDLIFAGKKRAAWDYFDRAYKLSDKVEIKRRVNAILTHQPVYRFIYNSPRSKR